LLAFVSFGLYLVALMSWVLGLLTQSATVYKAAKHRAGSGETPAWIHGFWAAGYLAEWTWVIGANVAVAVVGLALLQSGLVGSWAGWVGVGLGLAIPATALAAQYVFPEMSLIAPFVMGIGLIIQSL
jgi:hypothetical protein